MIAAQRPFALRRCLIGNMVLLVALILFTATRQATSEQSDFSGGWFLDIPITSNPDMARRLVVLQPITHTNVLGEPMKPAFLRITIRRESDSGNGQETRLISVVGGTTPGLATEGLPVGNSSRFETVWRHEVLVFMDQSYGPDGPGTGEWMERREEWSLERDGRLRVKVTAEGWKSTRRVVVYFYRRENAPQ